METASFGSLGFFCNNKFVIVKLSPVLAPASETFQKINEIAIFRMIVDAQIRREDSLLRYTGSTDDLALVALLD